MKKIPMICAILTSIVPVLFASSRVGRPLHNSPADMPFIALEISAIELPQGLRAPVQGGVICFDLRGHARSSNLSMGALLPLNLNVAIPEEVERKRGTPEEERKRKIAISNIERTRVLTEDEQREANAYKQKLEAGDLKQQADTQQQTAQKGEHNEEIGTYL